MSSERRFRPLVEEAEEPPSPAAANAQAAGPAPGASSSPPVVPPLAVAGYILATFAAFLDSNLLAPNLTAVAATFGFTPAERDWKLGGELAFGYFVVAAPVALLVGGMADSLSRRWLFAAVLLLGKLPCLLTYFAATYRQLFLLRTLMGITIGAVTPLISSLAGDMFPVETRTAATAVWSGTTCVGMLAGQYIAGLLGPTYGWRLPFLLVAIPGILAAGLVLLLPDPIRGRHEEALRDRFEAAAVGAERFQYQSRLTCAKVAGLFAIPSNVLGFAQGLPGCVPWGVIYAYFNDFLAQDRGMSVQEATGLMVVFGVANGFGSLAGGLLGQRLYNRWKPGMPLLMGATTLLGTAPTLCIINYPFDPRRPLALYTVAGLAGCLVAITGGNIRTVFLNVNPPEIRGTVFGIFCITDDVGKGFGPFIAAALIAALGRATAFNACVGLWAACAVLLAAIGLFLEDDERRMQAQLAVCVEMQTIGEDNDTTRHLEQPIGPAQERFDATSPRTPRGPLDPGANAVT